MLPSEPGSGPDTSSLGRAGERARRPVQVARGAADLSALHGGAADHPGADAERPRGQVRHALEPHPHRADEGVPLLLGMLPGQGGQLDAEAVGVDLEPLVVSVGQLHDEIVRHQRPALCDDRGAVVHLALYRAGDLHRLYFGFERPREGTLNHAFEPSLEAL